MTNAPSPGPWRTSRRYSAIAVLDADGKEVATFRYRLPTGTAEENAERCVAAYNATLEGEGYRG